MQLFNKNTFSLGFLVMVIINKPKTKKAASRLFEINVFIPTKALNLVTTLCYIISITYNGFSQKNTERMLLIF